MARGRAMVAGTLETRGATVGDLVGAWVHAHELVHKVPPAELHAEWSSIYAATRNVLTVHFQSEPADLLLFILWAAREQSKRVGDKAGRLSWRFVFSASRVSDYRVFTAVGA